jgi:hypothetical protein
LSNATAPPPLVPHLTAVRYVTPLREGGSLPAIVETDDGRLYVLKFRGAGQGTSALVAELIAAGVARALELPIPDVAVVQVEIGDLLRASVGTNFGMGYLPGAAMFTRGADPAPDGALASAIVWLDAYLMNVDRTLKNPNLLVQRGRHWLIDHGAALYWHHDWEATTDRSADRFPLIRDHVLLPWAEALPSITRDLVARLTDARIDAAVSAIPDDWLPGGPFATPAAHREGYRAFLRKRRDAAAVFVDEAVHARARLV